MVTYEMLEILLEKSSSSSTCRYELGMLGMSRELLNTIIFVFLFFLFYGCEYCPRITYKGTNESWMVHFFY